MGSFVKAVNRLDLAALWLAGSSKRGGAEDGLLCHGHAPGGAAKGAASGGKRQKHSAGSHRSWDDFLLSAFDVRAERDKLRRPLIDLTLLLSDWLAHQSGEVQRMGSFVMATRQEVLQKVLQLEANVKSTQQEVIAAGMTSC